MRLPSSISRPCAPGPDAGIIAIAPIDQIVPALRAGPGVIGDFVGGQSGGFGQFLRRFIETRRQIVVRNLQRAVLVQQREGRFRFDGELIERQMIGAEGQRLVSVRRAIARRSGPGRA